MFWLLENLDELHPEWDKNHVATWFWLCVDMRLSGAGRCFNLSQRNLHSSWGVNSFLWVSACGGTNKRRHCLWFLHSCETRCVIPLSMCAERCGLHGCRRLPEASVRVLVHLNSDQCFVTASPEIKCAHVDIWVRLTKTNKQTNRIKVWAFVQDYKRQVKTGWLAGFCFKWNKMLQLLFWLNVHPHICM